MADWKWFAGEPRGWCPGCAEPLRRSGILVEWRGRVYDVHCLLNVLTALAPADSYIYPTPGADGKAP